MIAGVFDQRMALIIPHHAGNGAHAPCRLPTRVRPRTGLMASRPSKRSSLPLAPFLIGGVPTSSISESTLTSLPFDQHSFISLCAPRPILVPTATEDMWANPSGQFEMVEAAESGVQTGGR